MKYYCVICGMEINNKNIDLNKHAFIHENKNEIITYCPFCGANHEYILSEDKLANKMLNGEVNDETKKILDHGVKLELFNSDFYKKASSIAKNENVKHMFLDLSRIEKMHAMIHFKLGDFEKLPKLTELNYSKYNSDNLLIEQALLREKHAVQFYNKYLPIIENKAIKDILIALMEIEKEHIKLLA